MYSRGTVVAAALRWGSSACSRRRIRRPHTRRLVAASLVMQRGKSRILQPLPLLDPVELGVAFDIAEVKRCHMKSLWKRILAGADSTEEVVQGMPQKVAQLVHSAFIPLTSNVLEVKPNQEIGTGAKLVVRLQDGQLVETVLIEHVSGARRYSTVCVSSQVGCRMGCTFCATGTMGLRSNLTTGEILEQVLHAQQRASFLAPVRNVVFMGMGEPLDNYDAVLAAVHALHEPRMFGLRFAHITISTVGVADRILALSRDCPRVNLAVSLHAPTQDARQRIVPSGGDYGIDEIMSAIDTFAATASQKVMIEYILIDGVNATVGDAERLGKLLSGRRVSVNLIPYNATLVGDTQNFGTPDESTCVAFQHTVLKYRDSDGSPIYTTLRRSSINGRSVQGACGQLVVSRSKVLIG